MKPEKKPRPQTRSDQSANVTGVLRVTTAGFALSKVGDEDVFIARGGLGAALDGDEVEIEILERAEKGPRGKVVRVLSRQVRRLCGVVEKDGFFQPDDKRYGRPLRCEGARRTRNDDDWVLCGAEVTTDLTPGAAEARLARSFGPVGAPRAEEDAIVWREQLDQDFAAEVIAEAQANATAVMSELDNGRADNERADLRALAFVTIDPATAEDHDDAIFAEATTNGGTRVVVAIADVSAFVPEGGVLDLEARRRGASLYFPKRVIPMLPPSISCDVASLVPNVDRPAMVLDLELDANDRVATARVVRAWIRSRARLSYDDAANVLRGDGSASSLAKTHAHTVVLVDAVARRLRSLRQQRGALAVETREVTIETDDSGFPTSMSRAEYDPFVSRAHQLVEEFMLLANETVGDMLRERGAEVLFRIHDAPLEPKLLRVVEVARAHGIEFPAAADVDAESLRDAIHKVADASVRDELSALLLDVMPTAIYATQRTDHFALAARNYVHFTSPIRRYADLTIHRALAALLLGGASTVAVDPDVVNQSQQRARAIQREVSDLYAALLMLNRRGASYVGTILRTTKQQWLVVLDEPAVGVRCARPQIELGEGARVRVKIESVSIATRTVEASFVEAIVSPQA